MNKLKFSMKVFLRKMVAAGYPPDSLDVIVQQDGSFRIENLDSITPERVVFFTDSSDLYATYSRMSYDLNRELLLKELKTFCVSDEKDDETPKFVNDSLEALL